MRPKTIPLHSMKPGQEKMLDMPGIHNKIE